ncbi:MFS transporter [Lysinibacillus piscis]|uniref:MFS transporter n=1 Tax=Lysinibacillus piscis TaxID=2518931 RepID=A0ABQ5NH20_9BACI|nr:MFS transporter [Lysinibacillus sp. KH24]GLC87646.1 MFS transporter [Lysinibacillus sp. KH24]
MKTSVNASKKPRFFYGYVITFLAILTYCAKSGILLYGAGPLVNELIKSFEWSNTEIGMAFTIKGLVGILSPLVGIAIIKWGPRNVLWYSGIVTTICFGLTAYVTQPWQFVLTYGVGLGIAMIFTQNIGVFTLINNWWEAKRGVMTGIVNGAGGVGQLLFLPLITWLLVIMDFKGAILTMTVILFVIGVLPQFIFIKNTPEQLGLQKDGGIVGVEKAVKPKKYYFSPVDWHVKDAIRSFPLWCIVLSWGASTWAFLTLTVFGFTHLTNQGFSNTFVATAMGAMGIMTIIGSVGAGMLVDRYGPRIILISSKVLLAIGYALFITASSTYTLWMTIIFLGIATGMNTPAVSTMIPSYFGNKNFAAIQGSVIWVLSFVSAASPLVSGWLADKTGSYTAAFTVTLVIILVGVVLAWAAKPPAVPTHYVEKKQPIIGEALPES